MTGEFNHNDTALTDIDRMFDIGVMNYLSTLGNTEEASFHIRQAYDRSWEEVWNKTFAQIDAQVGLEVADPRQTILSAFEKAGDMQDNSATKRFAQFALMCHWTKNESNEISLLFADGATYFYESKFIDRLNELCHQGDIVDERFDSTEHTAEFLRNYLAIAFLTWMAMPGEGGIDRYEAQLGVRNTLYGSGPTEYS
jgi:hypothetical protein